MGPPILIISLPIDIHAFAAAEALRRKGAFPVIWCTPDFPTLSSGTIHFRQGKRSVEIKGPNLEIDGGGAFLSVWHRRLLTAPDRKLLHPGDRSFASLQCEVFNQSVLGTIASEAFWVNTPASSHAASQKIFQHHEALQCGLSMPDTIFTNDPDAIRRFIKEAGGRVVSKTLTPASWRDDEDRFWTPYTIRLTTPDLVADELLRQTPAIYQAEVEKSHEVRMTVMGREVFAAAINSQDTVKGRLDWRLAYGELAMERTEVPADVRECCFSLMDRLGIVFGCFDFIVTPKKEWIFLEVNEMGQFLFIESYTGMPLLDAFADFLLAGKKDFELQNHRPMVRFSDLHESVRRAMIASSSNHVQAEPPRFYEGTNEEG